MPILVNENSFTGAVFSVPVKENFLLYAPLHHFVALLNKQALASLKQSIAGNNAPQPAIMEIYNTLKCSQVQLPSVRTEPLTNPFFLGLVVTRNCNMACKYCDFAAPKRKGPEMQLDIARSAIDGYLTMLKEARKQYANIHFFGGEPFFAANVIDFVVNYANMKASTLGIFTHFEVTTNGLFSEERCQWIANNIDTVVLSLDGIDEIQNQQRPVVGSKVSFPVVSRNAEILSKGQSQFIIRSCITQQSVTMLPDWAEWIAGKYLPDMVCFEPLSDSELSKRSGLSAPDPYSFVRMYDEASSVLKKYGIKTVLSTADIHTVNLSSCPVGKDALIVDPGGEIDACYLLKERWERKGMNMHLGRITSEGLMVDPDRLHEVRQINVYRKNVCSECFCSFHCAGGCHVNHDTSRQKGLYDDMCIRTRLITAVLLLRSNGLDQQAAALLKDENALSELALQPGDSFLAQDQDIA